MMMMMMMMMPVLVSRAAAAASDTDICRVQNYLLEEMGLEVVTEFYISSGR
jgi:hypothetical protein